MKGREIQSSGLGGNERPGIQTRRQGEDEGQENPEQWTRREGKAGNPCRAMTRRE
jgi:hypothetical protein